MNLARIRVVNLGGGHVLGDIDSEISAAQAKAAAARKCYVEAQAEEKYWSDLYTESIKAGDPEASYFKWAQHYKKTGDECGAEMAKWSVRVRDLMRRKGERGMIPSTPRGAFAQFSRVPLSTPYWSSPAFQPVQVKPTSPAASRPFYVDESGAIKPTSPSPAPYEPVGAATVTPQGFSGDACYQCGGKIVWGSGGPGCFRNEYGEDVCRSLARSGGGGSLPGLPGMMTDAPVQTYASTSFTPSTQYGASYMSGAFLPQVPLRWHPPFAI